MGKDNLYDVRYEDVSVGGDKGAYGQYAGVTGESAKNERGVNENYGKEYNVYGGSINYDNAGDIYGEAVNGGKTINGGKTENGDRTYYGDDSGVSNSTGYGMKNNVNNDRNSNTNGETRNYENNRMDNNINNNSNNNADNIMNNDTNNNIMNNDTNNNLNSGLNISMNNNMNSGTSINGSTTGNINKNMNSSTGMNGSAAGGANITANGGGNYRNVKNNNSGARRRRGGSTGGGFVLGVLVAVACMAFVTAGFMRSGYLHLALDGIYVTGTSSDETDGIGSKVEAKLNALDSVLDRNFYFDDVDDDEAADSIYKAYLAAYGDKYTVYYTPEEYQSMMESTTGTFYGIGAVCQQADEGGVLVVEPYSDAPAYNAGIRKNDRIIAVDGRDVTDMDLSAAVALIKGDKGTQVTLTVVRDGQKMEFTITRDAVNVQTVEYQMEEDSIGYIAISQFDDVTTQQFAKALSDLESQGMKGLIVDIRSNPGGVLSVVVDIVDMIVPKGLIVYTEDADGNRKEYNGSSDSQINVPMAVLVDGNSASASEIFAGVVQDYGKAKIIGTQTFGKGIVQTIQPLTDGSAIKYTIAKYYTAKGQDIHGHGVTPDIAVEYDSSAGTDNQYEAAFEYVKSQIQ